LPFNVLVGFKLLTQNRFRQALQKLTSSFVHNFSYSSSLNCLQTAGQHRAYQPTDQLESRAGAVTCEESVAESKLPLPTQLTLLCTNISR